MKANLLFLYSEVMPYTEASLNQLVEYVDGGVHLVFWNKGKTPYKPSALNNVQMYERQYTDLKRLIEILDTTNPALVYISGWMDKDYLRIARLARLRGIPVIGGLDTKWKGTIKQHFWSLVAPIILKKCISHLLIAGIYQFEYAKKLRYKNDHILWPVYSANVKFFHKIYESRVSKRGTPNTRNIIFSGRLVKEKGVLELLEAYKLLKKEFPGVKLKFLGNGELLETINQHEGVETVGFIDPDDFYEHTNEYDIFCLPSHDEPWGVVIHEFACAGFPIVTSKNCGAASQFVFEDYNGYLFEPGNAHSLKNQLKRLITMDHQRFEQFSYRSYEISNSINPKIWSKTILSVINE
ncbi:MAG: glycosyltransferase [Cytophagales bacterium]|nr:glycosyltransferase [Cytophagales bacterium]